MAIVVLITKRFEGTPYEVTLPRVPWLREQSYINVQSIQPVRFTEFVRKLPESLMRASSEKWQPRSNAG